MKNEIITRRDFLNRSLLVGAGVAASSFAGISCTESVPSLKSTDEFITYDALGLADLIKRKQLSAEELFDVIMRRIKVINPVINCIATPDYERARKRAGKINTDSLFAGVPTLIKDSIDVAGLRNSFGSKLMAANVPKHSVPWVKAAEHAGMNIIGTSTMPEFASGFESELYGQTRNPWNLNYSCVMSSTGAAAAVASGIIPLAHGTDGGGSNRYPTSACNVFGFKPSRGRMLSGETDGGHDLFKTNCGISRTVRDTAALFAVTEDTQNKQFDRMGMVASPSKKRLKIAMSLDGVRGFAKTVPAVRDVVSETARLLVSLGHEVDEIEHPLDGREFYRHFSFAYLSKFTPLLDQVKAISGKDAMDSELISYWTATMLESARHNTAEQIETGKAYLKGLSEMYATKVFNQYDVLLTPAMPIETPVLGFLKTTDDFREKGHVLEHAMSIGVAINPMGDCAMSVPSGFSEQTGIPVGSMFHAPMGQDKMLFELAYELEQARPWKHQWAPHSAKFIAV